MAFAALSIATIAADYQVSSALVCQICDRLGIPYSSVDTLLPLEDAKAVIMEILANLETPPTSQG
jgi:hypothetical protein